MIAQDPTCVPNHVVVGLVSADDIKVAETQGGRYSFMDIFIKYSRIKRAGLTH